MLLISLYKHATSIYTRLSLKHKINTNMSGKIRYIIEKLYRGILASVMKIKRESSFAGFNIQMHGPVGQYCIVVRICKHSLN